MRAEEEFGPRYFGEKENETLEEGQENIRKEQWGMREQGRERERGGR